MNQSPNATKCLTLVASSSEDEEIIDKEKTKVKKCPNRVYCHDKRLTRLKKLTSLFQMKKFGLII